MPVAVPALEHLKVNYRTHSGIMNVSIWLLTLRIMMLHHFDDAPHCLML